MSEFIFTSAPFPSCHASTVVELRGGSLMAAWFGGSHEGAPDVAIWHSLRVNGRWTDPAVLVREPDIAAYNPVLFYTHDGHLWFYYKFGPHPSQWTAGRRWSADHGQTWSQPQHLPAGLYGPIRAKPLVMADGTVVSGSSVESYHSWACWIERSTDDGWSWTRHGPIVAEEPAIIQPSVVQLDSRRLRLYARSNEAIRRICISDSTDRGVTWTSARPLDVPNPNSGIDAVAFHDGRVVLVYNNTEHGRTPLNLAISRHGEHFRMFRTLEDAPGEYSYPAMVAAVDGGLHITYTWKRQRICYAKIAAAEIPAE
jgi:predicted neuraminidase